MEEENESPFPYIYSYQINKEQEVSDDFYIPNPFILAQEKPNEISQDINHFSTQPISYQDNKSINSEVFNIQQQIHEKIIFGRCKNSNLQNKQLTLQIFRQQQTKQKDQKNAKKQKIKFNFDQFDQLKDEKQNIPKKQNKVKQNKVTQEKVLANQIKGVTLKQNKTTSIQYLKQKKAIRINSMKQFVFTPLAPSYKINAVLIKQGCGFLNMTPKYTIFIDQNNKFILSVLKSGISEYILSLSRQNISEDNKNFLGRMISNFSASQFTLYDYGFDVDKTRSLQLCKKQIAYIKYQQKKGPRKFQVFVAKNGQGYHSLNSKQSLLLSKYKKGDFPHVSKLTTKEPQYDPQENNYKLDFKGIVGKASVKNFILANEENNQCLIFGRKNDNTFVMEIKHPLSVFQAAAICVSSIHYKTFII